MLRKLSGMFLCFSLASLCLMTGASAAAQGTNAAHGNKPDSTPAKTKEVKFEVISIRPVKPGWSPYDGSPSHLSDVNPTPDGFTSTLTVWQMLMIAYAPVDQAAWVSIPVTGGPGWFYSHSPDFYFIDARVSNSDLAAWRNQSGHHELLRAAMRDLLKQRCSLVLHEQPTELPDYKLVIGKKGLKMKATAPGSALPKGAPLTTGGVRVGERGARTTWHYYGITIAEIVDFLGKCSPDRPVRDATGLTGRYDFTLQMIANPSHDYSHDYSRNLLNFSKERRIPWGLASYRL
jgi:uncharacterized protein (TIGR03435 family)